jgi:ribulose bisphosphate carboxylase small subunit
MKQKKAKPVSEASIEALEEAILDLHGCKATWIKSVPIKEVFEGETVWEGVVQVFAVDHPKSKLCYAWSYGLDNSKKRRVFAVLLQEPVDSPQAAIRATIVSEFRKTLKKAKGG